MRKSILIPAVTFLVIVLLYVLYLIIPEPWAPFLTFFTYALSIFCAFLVLVSKKRSEAKTSWLLIILFVPVIGITFYLLFGISYNMTRKYKKKEKIDNIIAPHLYKPIVSLKPFKEEEFNNFVDYVTNFTKTGPNYNTRTEVLTNGDKKYEKLIEVLNSAEKFIHLEYFIIHEGKIADIIKDILIKKAKQGVEVRLLYDHVGCIDLSDNFLRALRQSGVKTAAFNEVTLTFYRDGMNFRNHRKIVVVDGYKGFLGGINIGDEYAHKSTYYGFWRDTHLYLEGDAVYDLHLIFIKDWFFTTNESLFEEKYLINKPHPLGNIEGVHIVADGPDTGNTYIKDIYFKAINSAKKRILIATPYLIPDHDIEQALKIAARSGIDIKILVPGKPDKRFVYLATKSYFEDLMKVGIEIYVYNEKFMHSKVMIIDDKIASVGTANLDLRSFHTNFEVIALFYNGKSIQKLIEDFNNDLQDSTRIDLKTWQQRPWYKYWAETFARLFSPLF